jgi:hypothetical protein
MTEQNYRIRIKRGEVEIEAEGDREFVEKQIGELKKDIVDSATDSPRDEESALPEARKEESELERMSLGEFYNQKKPESHNDKVMVFAYWLTKNEKKEAFTAADILKCYGQVRVSKPKNLSQHVGELCRNGFLDVRPDKKRKWILTPSGENFVQKQLPPKGRE